MILIWVAMLKKLGLPMVTPHRARHFISTLQAQGIEVGLWRSWPAIRMPSLPSDTTHRPSGAQRMRSKPLRLHSQPTAR